jgi:hypothetical protein
MLSKTVRRPSPALIVAIVALVAALAGTAVALPGKNTVKSNDIAKNAVGSSDIKNNKVKGADVNEASLGKVPSAAVADSSNALAGHARFSAVVAEGEHNVATFGPFTLIGNCVIDDSGDDLAELYLTTSVDNAAMDSNSQDEFEDFDTGTQAFVLASDTVPTGDPEIEGEDAAQLVTQAPDGSSYGVDNELIAINMGGQAAQCHFAGVIEKLS